MGAYLTKGSYDMYKVECEDGVVRTGVFEAFADAQQWANYGHCCTNRHVLIVLDNDGGERERMPLSHT